jgi:hypothetical protein
MAKRANRPSKSPNPLEDPIVEPSALVVALIADKYRECPAAREAILKEDRAIVTRQKAEKLLLLGGKYSIDPTTHAGAIQLCMCIAEEYVPGFKVTERIPKGRGAPRKSYINLVQAVEVLVAVGKQTGERITVLGACKKLSKQHRGLWSGKDPKSLETRYHECRLEIARYRGIESDLIRRLEHAAKAAMA